MIQIKDYFLLVIFVPAILWFGFWTSLLDIRTGKVHNSLVRSGYIFGIIANTLLFSFSIFFIYIFPMVGSHYLGMQYFIDLLINLAISFIVGFAFWKCDFWAAADSKVFTLFTLLLPLTIYQNARMPYFPSFIFLLNIYIIYILFILISFLANFEYKHLKLRNIVALLKSKSKKFNSSILVAYIAVYYVTFLVGFSLQLIQIKYSDYIPVLFYISAFVVLNPLRNLVKKRKTVLSILLAVEIGYTAYVIIFSKDFSLVSSGKQLAIFAFYMMVMTLLVKLLNLSGQTERKMVRTEDISASMVLTQSSFIRIKNKKEFKESLGTIYPDGLLEGQIKTIKSLLGKENITEIEVFKTFPFVPFIFAGALATILIKDSIFHWFLGVIRLIHF